jgi:hypothetical protein
MRCSRARLRTVAALHAALGPDGAGSDYAFVGAIAPSRDGVTLPVLGDVRDLAAVLDRERVDELILTDPTSGDRELLEIVDHAHRAASRSGSRRRRRSS